MSNGGIKPRSALHWLFPFAVVYAAILIFSSHPSLKVRVPELTFAQIKPRFPARGLFPSAVIHAIILILFLYPPLFKLLNPPRIIEERWDDLRSTPVDSQEMTKLYYSAQKALDPAPASHREGKKHANASSPHGKRSTLGSRGRHVETTTVQSTYSGPQEVVSITPNPTNSIQTILRPDLINPPTLKFPQLLKPVVILRPSASAPIEAKPANPVPTPASAQHIKDTSVDPPAAKVPATVSLPAPEKRPQPRPLPQVETETPASDPLEAIVINAVTVPENAPVAIPQAELFGSFAVRPLQSSAGAGGSGESIASSDATKAAKKVEQGGRGEAITPTSETQTHKGADVSSATGKASDNNSAGNSNLNRSSQVTGTSPVGDSGVHGQAAHEVSGIAIIGGTNRGRSPVGSIATPRTTYGLTVISSGSSGGASRDLGVFDRSETVYTVYVPMADAGGGPDWSMQYAILGSQQAGNGLLTPPVAVKKVRAFVTGDLPNSPPTTIFFSAVISAKGELTVNPPRQMDARARQALGALRHWEFLPAQLNGVAVGIKVLVGVGTVSQ
jgi:hypothetical protein